MTKINDMLQTRLLKTLSIIAQVTMFTSCNSTAQNSSDGLSSQKKYFKNIQASILYPEGLQEIETDYSYTFTDNNDYIYIASVYMSQNLITPQNQSNIK
ncbi:MAG: hypothetical protein IPJ86_04415 [Bacteroidetes bacterium]|nr:hypothetical protein [Bacteroidota bacterium]